MPENIDIVKVAVGVIVNPQGLVLIARRPEGVHLGGLWEFPGGKCETGESSFQALKRELAEEVGIEPIDAKPLITLRYAYAEKVVELAVWHVTGFAGTAEGREGQPLRWVSPERLSDYQFPEANRQIIKALLLPRLYPILNDEGKEDERGLIKRLEHLQSQKLGFVQYRNKSTDRAEVQNRLSIIAAFCNQHGIKLLLNNYYLDIAHELLLYGVHLSSSQLKEIFDSNKKNALLNVRWVGASCHSLKDVEMAQSLDLDYVFFSPVNLTSSHPDIPPIGWNEFGIIVRSATIPVYALGGMKLDDLSLAIQHGAQGIAGITCFD